MGYIPEFPEPGETATMKLPWKWAGIADRDGDASPWKDAPLGSEYTYINVAGDDATLYLKTSTADADGDWEAQA